MAWHGIEGHDEIAARFRRAIARGRLASTFLFVGPPGIGKRMFADRLAQALLCETRPETEFDPCETCPACKQIAAASHPDFLAIECPPDRSNIPIDLLIGDKDHRGESGIIHHLSLRPHSKKRKIAVIDDADLLAVEGVNALLKTLEEPPPGSVLILIGTSPARQLPTIRSRCQLIRFRPLAPAVVEKILLEKELVGDPELARSLSQYCGGSVRWAMELADPELWDFVEQLFAAFAEVRIDVPRRVEAVREFVDKAGSQAVDKRARLRQVLLFSARFYRNLAGFLEGEDTLSDPLFSPPVKKAAGRWPADAVVAVGCAERCLTALEQVDRYANQQILIHAWLEDLDRMIARRASFIL
ncbi:DNA polymerase III subunit delta' [Thermostilla marina]